jgi:hypothetical protein
LFLHLSPNLQQLCALCTNGVRSFSPPVLLSEISCFFNMVLSIHCWHSVPSQNHPHHRVTALLITSADMPLAFHLQSLLHPKLFFTFLINA